jgi:hypothetical protein
MIQGIFWENAHPRCCVAEAGMDTGFPSENATLQELERFLNPVDVNPL